MKKMNEKIKLNEKELNIFKNLQRQIIDIAKHVRQGSFKTRDRYQSAVERFCKHLAKEFKTQKFANIQDKHLESYIKELQNKGRNAGYIKTELSAIRFYHNKCQNTKFELSDNEAFELEKREIGGVDRSWSDKSFEEYVKLCERRGRYRDKSIAVLAKELGMRIHETLRIDKNTSEKALKENQIHIKGKNGKWRYVPMTDTAKQLLFEQMKEVSRGEKLFVKDGEKTHLIIKQVQNFINKNREKFMYEEEGHADITFHGIRHKYARQKYEEFIKDGCSSYNARKKVSELLGHERDEVTHIYLAK